MPLRANKTPNKIKITGNLILQAGAKLTIPDADGANYHRLDFDVAGKVQLASDAVIDLNGKGFEGGSGEPGDESASAIGACA